jgi:hypothetical protein
MHSSHHIDLIETLNLSAENVWHGHSGSSIVSFQDRSWFPSSQEPPAQVFNLVESHAPQCVLFQEDTPHEQQVHSMHPHHALLVDSGSTITTVGRSDMMSSYVSPSPSGISMRSATGQIVRPEGEGRIPFDINTGTGSLSVVCQHTPAIKSNIFSPAATCDSLDYDAYQLTCDLRYHTSQVSFRKSGAPAITIHGTYVQRMPLISLPPVGINSLVPTVPRLLDIAPSARQPEPLDADSSLAIHQVLRLISLAHHHPVTTPEYCWLGIIHLFHESLSDDWTHGGLPVAPVLHVSDAVSRTLWHMRTCHPHPERLVLLSKIAKGVPKFKHPQDIEKCSDCLIAKLRKAAQVKAPGFTTVSLGQGLAIDVGFMFQRSKNAARAKRITGVNGNNAYCVIYDFFSELVFGVTSRGKTIPLAWLNILLTRIAPHNTPVRIVRLDLGGDTGKNPDIQALFLKHGFILEQ